MAEKKKCGDCDEEFDDADLICAATAESVDICPIHPDGTCTEVYCENCWEAEAM